MRFINTDPSKPTTLLPTLSKRQITTICFSNIIACFSFVIYLRLSDTLSTVFFPPSANDSVVQLQILSVFMTSFLVRPIGAYFIGRYGDVYGRKSAHIVSLLFLSSTALLTACLPTYSQAGLIAPISFVIISLMQAMFFGAYAPLGWVIISEHIPKTALGQYCGLITASLVAGSLIASIVTTILNDLFTNAELVSYGWRIPFIIGGVFSVIALILSRSINETPQFIQKTLQNNRQSSFFQLRSFFKEPQAIFMSSALCTIYTSMVIVVIILLPDLIQPYFRIDSLFLVYTTLIGLLFSIVGCVFFGVLASRYGVGRALIFGGCLFIALVILFYVQLHISGSFILLMYAFLGFGSGMMSLCPIVLVQLFSIQNRLTSVSIAYNTMFAIAGAILPLGLFYFSQHFIISPAIYLTFIGMITVAIGLQIYRKTFFSFKKNIDIY